MREEEFERIAKETEMNFASKIHAFHQGKTASWQFLIQLSTDLLFDNKDSYGVPIEICRMEDSEEKTRSIILWRLSERNESAELIKFAAKKIDEICARLKSAT